MCFKLRTSRSKSEHDVHTGAQVLLDITRRGQQSGDFKCGARLYSIVSCARNKHQSSSRNALEQCCGNESRAGWWAMCGARQALWEPMGPCGQRCLVTLINCDSGHKEEDADSSLVLQFVRRAQRSAPGIAATSQRMELLRAASSQFGHSAAKNLSRLAMNASSRSVSGSPVMTPCMWGD